MVDSDSSSSGVEECTLALYYSIIYIVLSVFVTVENNRTSVDSRNEVPVNRFNVIAVINVHIIYFEIPNIEGGAIGSKEETEVLEQVRVIEFGAVHPSDDVSSKHEQIASVGSSLFEILIFRKGVVEGDVERYSRVVIVDRDVITREVGVNTFEVPGEIIPEGGFLEVEGGSSCDGTTDVEDTSGEIVVVEGVVD